MAAGVTAGCRDPPPGEKLSWNKPQSSWGLPPAAELAVEVLLLLLLLLLLVVLVLVLLVLVLAVHLHVEVAVRLLSPPRTAVW